MVLWGWFSRTLLEIKSHKLCGTKNVYTWAESKASDIKVWGEFLPYNIAVCNWILSICNFLLWDLEMAKKGQMFSFTSYFQYFLNMKSLPLLYVLMMEKRSCHLVSLREYQGSARWLIFMLTYFGDWLIMKVLVLLWIRWVRTGHLGNEGKIPLNRSVLVVIKFAAFHYVKICCKPNNTSVVLIAFAAKGNKVRNSAFIVMKASSPCGQRNKTLKIWHMCEMLSYITRLKFKIKREREISSSDF